MINKKNNKIFYCILRKSKNNFFFSLLKNDLKNIVFKGSSGMLNNIKGSKKYSTIAMEGLGRLVSSVVYLNKEKDNIIDFKLYLKFKMNKFVRSFLKGYTLYGKNFSKISIYLKIAKTHNGLRPKKLRRI